MGAPKFEETVKRFFFDKTRELMQRESCSSVGTSTHTVDIVRDVLKVVPIYWVCDLVRLAFVWVGTCRVLTRLGRLASA